MDMRTRPPTQPVTRTVLRVQLSIEADFKWVDKYHGGVEPWWIYIEDAENEVCVWEIVLLHKNECVLMAFHGSVHVRGFPEDSEPYCSGVSVGIGCLRVVIELQSLATASTL